MYTVSAALTSLSVGKILGSQMQFIQRMHLRANPFSVLRSVCTEITLYCRRVFPPLQVPDRKAFSPEEHGG